MTIVSQLPDVLERRLEALSRRQGRGREEIIEEALRAWLEAHEEDADPQDTPTHVIFAPSSAQRIVEQLLEPAPPTDALVELMRGR